MSYSKEDALRELARRELQSRQQMVDPQAAPDSQSISADQFAVPTPETDWQSTGGQVVNPNEQPSTPELLKQGRYKEALTFDSKPGVEKAWDRIGANVQAGYTGVLSLGSSMVKIADKLGMAPEGSAKSAQKTFDEAYKIYESGQYPETVVSKLAGEMLLPGGLPVKAGAKLGGAILGKAGEYIGSAAGGSVAGGVTGGLLNVPGNAPTDVWNEEMAATGAKLGAPLGMTGQALSKWGKNTANMQVAQEELEQVGYKGPVLSHDYGSEVIGQIKSNWMDNIVATGIRDEQINAITPAVKQLLGSVTHASEAKGASRIGEIIQGVNTKLKNESSARWSKMFDDAAQQGITKIDTPLTKQSTAEFLEQYGNQLTKTEKSVLDTLARSKQVDMKTLNQVKGLDIWRMHQKYGDIDQTAAQNMSEALKDMYWNMSDDIGAALKDSPKLAEAWRANRAFTSGVKSIFNMGTNRKLTNAINDLNENTGQLKTFVNSVLSPLSDKQQTYYGSVLGQDFLDESSKLAFNKIFLKNLNPENQRLNFGQFMDDIAASDSKGLLNNPTVKALDVLNKHYRKIQDTAEAGKNSMAKELKQFVPLAQVSSVLGTGAYMAGAGAAMLPIVGAAGGVAAAVLLAPRFLGWISKASPAKNLLIGASKAWGKNPKLTEHIMDIVGKKMAQAGVSMKASQDGVQLDMQEKK